MSRPRILVIDDDPSFRSFLMSLLRSDYVVFIAVDGAEGLWKAEKSPPQLVILDAAMPVMDGLQALRILRRNPLLAGIPVLMLGDASRETVIAALQAGANDYIIKDTLTREGLLNKVRLVLKQEGRKPAQSGAESPLPRTASPPPVTAAEAASPEAPAPAAVAAPAVLSEADLQAVLDNWE